MPISAHHSQEMQSLPHKQQQQRTKLTHLGCRQHLQTRLSTHTQQFITSAALTLTSGSWTLNALSNLLQYVSMCEATKSSLHPFFSQARVGTHIQDSRRNEKRCQQGIAARRPTLRSENAHFFVVIHLFLDFFFFFLPFPFRDEDLLLAAFSWPVDDSGSVPSASDDVSAAVAPFALFAAGFLGQSASA